MKTDLRDWTAAASGRVYSVATVQAAEHVRWRRRLRIRAAIHRGVLPSDPAEQPYATALARDLDRMRPNVFKDRGRWIGVLAYPLLFVSAALDSNWVFAAVCVGLSVIVAVSAFVQRNDRRTLRTVVIDGYDRMTEAERSAFNHAVREPLRLERWEWIAGGLSLGVPLLVWGWVIAFAIQFDAGDPADWRLISLFGVIFSAIVISVAVSTRRRFLKEMLGEARPIEPPVSVASLRG